MSNGYIEEGYIEDDYFEEETMAVTPLPDPPNRGDDPDTFIQKGDAFIAAWQRLSVEMEAAIIAMNNNSTNSTSVTSNTIASSGSKTFTVQLGKGYLPGQTIKAASTSNGTIWMQGDVTAYDFSTGLLSIAMNASQGSGTLAAWTLTLATSVANATGSLSQDYSVKSLTHAIGGSIAAASTLDLSAATGNMVIVTGNAAINAVTMAVGKDIWVVFAGTPQLNWHVSNHQLNSNGANIVATAGSRALYMYDGSTVRVLYFSTGGKANVETAAPAGAAVGSGLIHFGSTAPANYLAVPLAPTNVSRATYAALFAAIGTTWGSGDGSTTFGLPWMPANYAMLQATSNVGTSWVGEVLSHQHDYSLQSQASSDAHTGMVMGSGSFSNTASGTPKTAVYGGTANLAAGSRILICVRYQ